MQTDESDEIPKKETLEKELKESLNASQ